MHPPLLQGSLLLMVVQWRDPEVQSKKRREAEALERQQGMECDDDKDNNKVKKGKQKGS